MYESVAAFHENATLYALLDAAIDGMVTIDNKGVITGFNPAAEKMFAYAKVEVIGQNVSCLMSELYADHHDQYIQNYYQTGVKKIIGIGRQVTGKRKDGQLFPVELSVGEIFSQGESVGFVGIIRDVTDKVRADQESKSNREQLAHVTRLNTMGAMAAGIAHEVNQPLTAVASYAQACKRLLGDTFHRDETSEKNLVKVLEILEKIDQQARRASEVMQRLRNFVKRKNGQMSVVSIKAIIYDTLALAKTDTRLLDHPVDLELESDLPSVLADPIQIQQVLLNLIRNGIDAIEAEPMQEASRHRPENLKLIVRRFDDTCIEVVVIDYGIGLTDEGKIKLFHPFVTTKDHGMGIGLCVSRGIVQAHGGRLWHQDLQGRSGSAFHFTLVIAEGEA